MTAPHPDGTITPEERSEAARDHDPRPDPIPGSPPRPRHRPGARTDQTGITGPAGDATRDLGQKPVSPTTTRPGGFSP